MARNGWRRQSASVAVRRVRLSAIPHPVSKPLTVVPASVVVIAPRPTDSKMTSTVGKGADLMEILKKKMRQSKEDLERVRDENEEVSHKLQLEVQRRETVSVVTAAVYPSL